MIGCHVKVEGCVLHGCVGVAAPSVVGEKLNREMRERDRYVYNFMLLYYFSLGKADVKIFN